MNRRARLRPAPSQARSQVPPNSDAAHAWRARADYKNAPPGESQGQAQTQTNPHL